MVRIQIHIAAPQLKRLRSAAEREGVPMAELIRRVVSAYLDETDRAQREGRKR